MAETTAHHAEVKGHHEAPPEDSEKKGPLPFLVVKLHEGGPAVGRGSMPSPRGTKVIPVNQEEIVDPLLETHEKSPTVHLSPEDDEGR